MPGFLRSSIPVSRFALCALIVAGLTIVRLIGLRYSITDLYFDESQYWVWSREWAFGYFSKPPLLAWTIAIAERICGSGEACIRSPSPILHGGTALIAFGIARELYNERTAFWSCLVLAFGTGVVFSSRIISTDVPFLFLWSLALLAWLKLIRRPNIAWAAVLGVALGFGLLAKYAMVYFLLCAGIAAVFHQQARRLLRRRDILLALLIAVLIVFPNIFWNITNGLATFRHTATNVGGAGLRFTITGFFSFFFSQFAVAGPIVFGGFVVAMARWRRQTWTKSDIVLLAFSLPVVALVMIAAFVSNAYPNWMAPALVAMTILVTALLVRAKQLRWIYASIAIGAVVQLVFLVADAYADRLTIPFLKKPDVYERTMGWRLLGDKVTALARDSGAKSVAGERRYDVPSLLYYLRDGGRPVTIWKSGAVPKDHFELKFPLAGGTPEPVLLITPCPFEPRLRRQFAGVEPLGTFAIRTGPTTAPVYHAFELTGLPREIEPAPACS
jgi:4-amino-4-deoxy-L-arabinose transferase-like glycosyltransferase